MDDHVATIYEAYQADIYLSLEDFKREVARWRTHWVITVVGLPHRLDILSDTPRISKDLAKLSAELN
jgi:hypothetical protein